MDPPDGSPLRITQKATVGHRDGSLRYTAVGWTTAKVMVGCQSGGQEDFEDKHELRFCSREGKVLIDPRSVDHFFQKIFIFQGQSVVDPI